MNRWKVVKVQKFSTGGIRLLPFTADAPSLAKKGAIGMSGIKKLLKYKREAMARRLRYLIQKLQKLQQQLQMLKKKVQELKNCDNQCIRSKLVANI